MSRKAFQVQVELDVQAVTCPGVWLCTNGKVSLQIYMLDSCVQTASYKPSFPIQCHESFLFYKTFYSKHQLQELQKQLHNQWLYMELVQWQSCEVGNVLAVFQTTLDELLYPSSTSGSIIGVDIDLLMEPSKIFPGTIAPKIEISTKTTIEEILCKCNKPSSSTVVVNPKLLTSVQKKPRQNHSRKVCHSIGFSKKKSTRLKQTKTKPLFCYRKAEDDLILRRPQYDLKGNYCSCRSTKSLENLSNVRKQQKTPDFVRKRDCGCSAQMCLCGHREQLCQLCSKYKGYFNKSPKKSLEKLSIKDNVNENKTRKNMFYNNNKSEKQYCELCSSKAINLTDKKTESEASSDVESKCQCFLSKKSRSLAEKLHAKLNKTLSSIPKFSDCSCYDDYTDDDYDSNDEGKKCDCSECSTSKKELYKNLQKFYGDLYKKSKSKLSCQQESFR